MLTHMKLIINNTELEITERVGISRKNTLDGTSYSLDWDYLEKKGLVRIVKSLVDHAVGILDDSYSLCRANLKAEGGKLYMNGKEVDEETIKRDVG